MSRDVIETAEHSALSKTATVFSIGNREMSEFQASRSAARVTGDPTSLDFNSFPDIYGSGFDKLASRANESERNSFLIAENKHDKPVPPEGRPITLKQLLNDYKTPIIDAYEHSKHLQDGQSGKSKTLEEVIDRLKACPWADKIRIVFKEHPNNPEYSNEASTITIDTADSAERQIENFAHEAFHATHQFLSSQYDNGKLTQKQFVNQWISGEVDSMLAETRVHQELGLKTNSPIFKYVEDGQAKPLNIAEYVKEHGKGALHEFLRTHQPTGRDVKPYGAYYAGFYDAYIRNFELNQKAVRPYIQNWVNSGHRREDI